MEIYGIVIASSNLTSDDMWIVSGEGDVESITVGGTDAVGFRSFRAGSWNHTATENPVISGAVTHADGETAAAMDRKILKGMSLASYSLNHIGKTVSDRNAVSGSERRFPGKPDLHFAATRRDDLRFPGEASQIGAERAIRKKYFKT